MNIRLMTINDYEKVYDLWMSCKGMGLNNLDDTKEGINKLLKRNPKTCFVAVESKKVIGVILTGHDGRRAYIYHMAVREEYRRRKIGTNLLNIALNAIKEEGINKVALVHFKRNQIAYNFWTKMGFNHRKDISYRDKELNKIIRMDT